MVVVVPAEAEGADLGQGVLDGLEVGTEGSRNVGRPLGPGPQVDNVAEAGPACQDQGPGLLEAAQGVARLRERDDGALGVLVVRLEGGVEATAGGSGGGGRGRGRGGRAAA